MRLLPVVLLLLGVVLIYGITEQDLDEVKQYFSANSDVPDSAYSFCQWYCEGSYGLIARDCLYSCIDHEIYSSCKSGSCERPYLCVDYCDNAGVDNCNSLCSLSTRYAAPYGPCLNSCENNLGDSSVYALRGCYLSCLADRSAELNSKIRGEFFGEFEQRWYEYDDLRAKEISDKGEVMLDFCRSLGLASPYPEVTVNCYEDLYRHLSETGAEAVISISPQEYLFSNSEDSSSQNSEVKSIESSGPSMEDITNELGQLADLLSQESVDLPPILDDLSGEDVLLWLVTASSIEDIPSEDSVDSSSVKHVKDSDPLPDDELDDRLTEMAERKVVLEKVKSRLQLIASEDYSVSEDLNSAVDLVSKVAEQVEGIDSYVEYLSEGAKVAYKKGKEVILTKDQGFVSARASYIGFAPQKLLYKWKKQGRAKGSDGLYEFEVAGRKVIVESWLKVKDPEGNEYWVPAVDPEDKDPEQIIEEAPIAVKMVKGGLITGLWKNDNVVIVDPKTGKQLTPEIDLPG